MSGGLRVEKTNIFSDIDYLKKLVEYFNLHNVKINLESNDQLTDFQIMKQCKILICTGSTMSWAAAFLSNDIEKCYIPIGYKPPIQNTIYYI